ncbi:MAG: hypothetical protein HKN42_16200 [Granulosicoccus sp.]|nr:hypothetical protein [Granulosicoccus sp.]
MNSRSTRAGIIALAALSCLLSPASGFAQSVDQCMSARLADALKICKSILDSGSRNPDVYWKLSSAQYQDGQKALANRTLDDALRLHPGDAKLSSLKEIISTDSTEQALIARSAKLNQLSLDKGALKISCLTKSGDVGITACKRRLELTDEDGARIRTRLASLEETQSANRQATAPVNPLPDPEPAPEAGPDPEPQPVVIVESPATNTAAADQSALAEQATDTDQLRDNQQQFIDDRRQAYKRLVTDVQSRLNEMGFDAGYPDGVPGSRTRQALTDFYRAVDLPVVTSITDLTLEDLDAEKRKLDRARVALKESRTALAAGDLDLARSKRSEASRLSGLLTVPAELELALRAPTPEAVVPPAVTTSPPTPTTPVQTVVKSSPVQQDSSRQFVELMGRINTLHGRIRRQLADQQRQLEQLRDAL